MTFAFSRDSNDGSAGVRAIKATEQQWNKDMAAKNLDALVAHYTSDATLRATGMPHATGEAAIRSALKQMLVSPRHSAAGGY